MSDTFLDDLEEPARPKGGVGQGARALLEGLPAILRL